jgi:WD40 repeat protein
VRATVCVFTPQGRALAAGFSNGLLENWDLTIMSKIYKYQLHDGMKYSLAFSYDGKILASCG